MEIIHRILIDIFSFKDSWADDLDAVREEITNLKQLRIRYCELKEYEKENMHRTEEYQQEMRKIYKENIRIRKKLQEYENPTFFTCMSNRIARSPISQTIYNSCPFKKNRDDR